MILAGDIGGTKTNLALYERDGAALEERAKTQFASRDYASLGGVITDFLPEGTTVDAACFGLAGPVIEGRCRTTNLPWDVTTTGLRTRLGTDKVRLLNDLEATAFGMLYLDDEAFEELNPTARRREGHIAVIAAGTGLGEAMLYYDGTAHHPIGSEGGHCDFAPVTPQQDQLLIWMRKRYPGHVSYERILSGPGVYTLYEFLAESNFAPQPPMMLNLAEGEDKSAMVSRCALEHNDPLCREALRLFAEIYGAEAGNLALKTMALGGVYVGGGIAPKILPILSDRHFLNGFVTKGRFEEMLRGIPVRVARNAETALLGAARYAADRM